MPNAKYTRAGSPKIAHPAEVLQNYKAPESPVRRESEKKQVEVLAGLKEQVLGQSLNVLRDHLRFRDIDPYEPRDESKAFKQMVEELGQEEAEKTYRLAEAGWRTAAAAPVGVKHALNITIGIMKANATEKSGPKTFNVGKVLIDSSLIPQFEEREVE